MLIDIFGVVRQDQTGIKHLIHFQNILYYYYWIDLSMLQATIQRQDDHTFPADLAPVDFPARCCR